MFDTASATAALSESKTGMEILSKVQNGNVERALDKAYEGRFGPECAALAARLPKFWVVTSQQTDAQKATNTLLAAEKAAKNALEVVIKEWLPQCEYWENNESSGVKMSPEAGIAIRGAYAAIREKLVPYCVAADYNPMYLTLDWYDMLTEMAKNK